MYWAGDVAQWHNVHRACSRPWIWSPAQQKQRTTKRQTFIKHSCFTQDCICSCEGHRPFKACFVFWRNFKNWDKRTGLPCLQKLQVQRYIRGKCMFPTSGFVEKEIYWAHSTLLSHFFNPSSRKERVTRAIDRRFSILLPLLMTQLVHTQHEVSSMCLIWACVFLLPWVKAAWNWG